MNITYDGQDVVLEGTDFDPAKTLDCGQAFRWSCGEGRCFGVAHGRPLEILTSEGRVTLKGAAGDFETVWRRYFDIDRDYAKINEGYVSDPVLLEGMKYASGIRILNQEPFETLISFIISANNNIGRIKGIISRLCALSGEEIGEGVYAFPTAASIASLSEEELLRIGSGYRARYILKTARMVLEEGDPARLSCLPYEEAVKELCRYSGVGRKVADCVALFSLGFTQAFPLDVWMKRVLFTVYGLDGKADANVFISSRFGEHAGIAQQYLFYYARANKLGVK